MQKGSNTLSQLLEGWSKGGRCSVPRSLPPAPGRQVNRATRHWPTAPAEAHAVPHTARAPRGAPAPSHDGAGGCQWLSAFFPSTPTTSVKTSSEDRHAALKRVSALLRQSGRRASQAPRDGLSGGTRPSQGVGAAGTRHDRCEAQAALSRKRLPCVCARPPT